MAETLHRIVQSPVGPITLAGDSRDVLRHLCLPDEKHPPVGRDEWRRADGAFAAAADQLAEYFDGGRSTFELELDLVGTAFQRRVWAALLEIPYGETWSYGDVATHIGQPRASRAVGLANGRNPVAIIVPCHRVIGADGSLTGYGGGLDCKLALLDLERSSTRTCP